MPPHKRDLSTGEIPTPKRRTAKTEQSPTPAMVQPQWGFLTARKDPSAYADDEDKFVALELYMEVDDANRRIRALAKVDHAGIEELWEKETGLNGELKLSCVDEEGSGVIFEVMRLPLRAAGYVGPVEKRSDEKHEWEGDDSWKEKSSSEDEQQQSPTQQPQ